MIRDIVKYIKNDLPGEDGWNSKSTTTPPINLAEDLLDLGMSKEKIIDHLEEVVSAIRNEYGD